MAGPCFSFTQLQVKYSQESANVHCRLKKAQEMGSNELLRSPVPPKWDVLLNSESLHSVSAMSTLKLHFGIIKHAFQKTSATKTQGSNANKVLPLSECRSTEQVSEKIDLHQLHCNKINLLTN